MPEQNITLIAEQEAQRLCPNDSDARRKEYQRAILASLREWEAYRERDPKAMKWDLLDAMIARLEAEHHPSTEYYQDRITRARGFAFKLLEEHGAAFVMAHPVRRRIATNFELPGFTAGHVGLF